jgi:protein-L-isoaspartate(D-aspartate) O-methyltransferase
MDPAMQPSPADLTNQQMVDRLIAEGALWSEALVAAFRATPRHRFLDRVFQYHRRSGRWREVITRDPGPDELRLVYSDRALITRLSGTREGMSETPISSSSQPSLMAQMLEDLRPRSGCRILEIGAGTGYNAALLAHVAGPGRVVSIDVERAILAEAWEHLRHFSERRVELKQGDGRGGFPEGAPYDRIMVTAATSDLEPAWLEQLADNGLLLAPLALTPVLAFLVRGTARDGLFHGRLTRAAYFMPLRGEGEVGASDSEERPLPAALQTLPAPWAGWFDRRHPRVYWHGFIQALTFYGLLRGLEVHHRGSDNGQPLFGVSAADDSAVCWLGSQDWQVNGSAGRDLGWTLWRAFLDASGPWPTEFDLTASPRGGLQAGRRESYLRQGLCCQQLWELIDERDRPAWL